jgi:hypothetical protein
MSKNVLGATALALLIGVSAFSLNTAAVAQNGGEARGNDRANQKKLDDRELTPIRPIRRVGEDSWPSAKNQPAPVRETTGQTAKEEPAKDTAQDKAADNKAAQEKQDKQEKKENTAQNTAKPAAKPEPKNSSLGNQSPPPDKNTAKEDTKQDTAKQENKQESAKPDAKQAQAPQQGGKQDTAQNDGKDAKNFASIRLGTDESGRVAVNEAQQRQIAKAVRKHHVENVNVKVSVGSVAPANVRLVAVSSDLVDVLPQFRGDSMFVTSDGIVIVEPSSKKVIALVPVKLTATASREERTTETRAKPPARTAVKERDVTVSENRDEQRFPTREEILAAPVAHGPAGTTVTRTYRSYRYEPDDDVVVIERRRPRIFGFW